MCESFENLFINGTQHRIMLFSEANASILRVACRCIDLSSYVAKHMQCDWSIPTMTHAKQLKENLLAEYDRLTQQWKMEVKMEKQSREHHLTTMLSFPRITLTQKSGYATAVKEVKRLNDLIHKYAQLPSASAKDARQECCRAIAEQSGRLTAVLAGLVDEQPFLCIPAVQQDKPKPAPDCDKKITINQAKREQKSDVLNRLQMGKRFTSNVIMELSNENLYVISCRDTDDHESYQGFVFVDSPVHKPARTAGSRTARITYIEILHGHRRSSLAKTLIQWIKINARENGFQSLYATSVLPNENFWEKCGFKMHTSMTGTTVAICDVNPMSIENLINKTSF